MCVLFQVFALLLRCFWVVECFCVIRLNRTPFGRALTSSLIEPLVPRLATRCRGGSRRRGRSVRVWIWRAESFRLQKTASPLSHAVACFGVLLPSAPLSSVFDLRTSARPSFLLHAFTTYTNGWIGQGTGVLSQGR